MDIKTVTFHRSHNYGAVLQAYALQQALLFCGHSNQIIDYALLPAKMFSKIITGSLKGHIINLLKNYNSIIFYKRRKALFNKFELFIKNELVLTKQYNTYEELKSNPPKADCYLAGSDQLWNMTYRISPEFFLEFGDNEGKRVTYAVSMGMYNLMPEQLRYLQIQIRRFNSISVREKAAKDYIEQNTDAKCRVDIDPVFLLNKKQWFSKAVTPAIKEKYILCFPLINNNLLQPAINRLKKTTNLKVVVITNSQTTKIKGEYYIYDADPFEFLGWIKNAEYVLTTSFHGTAFSIIMEKKFFSFLSDWAPTRISGLLEELNLSDRIVKTIDDINQNEINYGIVKKLKQHAVDEAYDYLRNL